MNLGEIACEMIANMTTDEMQCKITRKSHSKTYKIAHKITFFIKVLSFVSLYRKNTLSLQKFSAEKGAKSDFPTI